jgi:hypothetical protein
VKPNTLAICISAAAAFFVFVLFVIASVLSDHRTEKPQFSEPCFVHKKRPSKAYIYDESGDIHLLECVPSKYGNWEEVDRYSVEKDDEE